MTLDASLRAKVLQRARQERSRTRAQVTLRHGVATVSMLGVAFLVFIAAGGVRSWPRPSALVLETALGSAILALVAAIIALGRGGTMLGRPRSHLVAVTVLTPILLLAWRVFASSGYTDMLAAWPGRLGFRCFLLTAGVALAPLLGLLWMRRGSDPVHPRASAAAVGASVGAGAWVLVDLWCPISYVPHLLVGHVLPMVCIVFVCVVFASKVLK